MLTLLFVCNASGMQRLTAFPSLRCRKDYLPRPRPVMLDGKAWISGLFRPSGNGSVWAAIGQIWLVRGVSAAVGFRPRLIQPGPDKRKVFVILPPETGYVREAECRERGAKKGEAMTSRLSQIRRDKRGNLYSRSLPHTRTLCAGNRLAHKVDSNRGLYVLSQPRGLCLTEPFCPTERAGEVPSRG
jgi:hypothetical protein